MNPAPTFDVIWDGRESLMGDYPLGPSPLLDPRYALDDTPLWSWDQDRRKKRLAILAAQKRVWRTRRCACGCGGVISPDRTARYRRGCAKRIAGGRP